MTMRVKKLSPALFSSKKQSHCTDEKTVALIKSVAPIGLDPCSNPRSVVKARVEWMRENGDDGLRRPWAPVLLPGEQVYVNPPFKPIDSWAEACAATGATAPVMLLGPARTERPWFQDFTSPAIECGARAVCFWGTEASRRLRFLGQKADAPFPAIFAAWGPDWYVDRFVEVFEPWGSIWLCERDVLRLAAPEMRDCTEPRRFPPARHDWPPRLAGRAEGGES